mmetsp:Transcript_396/g.722  ORF Transcript_396/g.722 Transcript_396/m.722 type:complete len:323 (-) Transcript_396:399-1367(-)|eukprot:CAMPEP_0119325342 /NCGR_PEP_ID=MMETSP1333-20130426/65564_1 /TAXON_ID=418940 /ORGANISM="Scyphosphaera apsteinii, Strain RCC1455" /LENGTH=322 /DNA_ID=CAMNT_0007333307 /DNA_START=113 /DNA_END=1081 /DNA_ORIENTATION=-
MAPGDRDKTPPKQPPKVLAEATSGYRLPKRGNGTPRMSYKQLRHGQKLGSEPGSEKGQFEFPAYAAMLAGGDLAICDAGNNRVQVISPDGEFRRSFGCEGTEPGEFDGPIGIAVCIYGGEEVLLVSDSLNNRVQRLSAADGSPMGMVGGVGSGAGELNSPDGICVASDKMYVVDNGNKRVAVFDMNFEFRAAFGGEPQHGMALKSPRGITTTAAGELVVSDDELSCVFVFTLDGILLRTLGSRGSKPGHFDTPWGLCACKGTLLVVENVGKRLQVIDLNGGLVQSIAGPQFGELAGVCVDKEEQKVFVTDYTNGVVHVFLYW